MSKTGTLDLASGLGGKIDKKEVISAVDQYEKYHVHYGGEQEARKANYTDMVNKYYDLATSFYEYGWGESFHFANRWKGESLRESIKRHEHFLALQLSLKPGMKVLDVGCGIGGPLREIARFRDTNWSDPGPRFGSNIEPVASGSECPGSYMLGCRSEFLLDPKIGFIRTLFLTRDFGY